MLSNFLPAGRPRFQKADQRLAGDRKRRRMRSRRRLALENLEGRIVLSTMYVNSAWATGYNPGDTVEIGDSGETATIGTDAFGAIQAAINAASDGDDIEIAEGTYTETLRINKSLTLVGEGSDKVIIDVKGGAATGGVYVPNGTSDVSLSGFSVVGETSNGTVRYGIYAAGATNVHIDNVIVETTSRSGINLNGVTDFSITNATVIDTTGAGIFMTDVKDGTLSNITTSGNPWTGIGFSTYGRDHDIGVERIIISGNNSIAESATPNGGVMFEMARWDSDAKAFDPDNPQLITYSTNLGDEADVIFDFGEGAPWLGYVLTGEQDDNWTIRYNFYGTLEQGLSAALDTHPGHYTGEDIELSPVAPTTGAPILDGPSEIDRGSTYTLTLTPAADAGAETEWVIDWGDGTIETIPSTQDPVTHDYANEPSQYTIRVTEIVAGVYTSGASEFEVSVLNVNPTIEITGAPLIPLGRGVDVSLGSDAGGPDADDLTYAWSVERNGQLLPDASDEATFDFTTTLPGVYVVTLTATGRFDGSTTTTAEFTVINAAPTVEITKAPEGPVARNHEVELSAAGEDGDGDDLTFNWVVTFDGEQFATGSGADFAFTPLLPGAYHVSVTASDGYEHSTPATVAVIASNAEPTVAITGAPDSVNQGQAITLGSSASDPDGDPLNYAWTVTRGGAVVLTGDAENLYFAQNVPGEYLITLTVTDPHGGSATATHAVSVVGVAPTVAITGAPDSVNQGESIHLTSEVVNPAGGALAYVWTVTRDGVVVHASDGETLDFTPTAPGQYVVTLTVTDVDGDAGSAAHAISVVNVAPEVAIAPLPDATIMSGDVVNLAATASSSNPNAALSYAWTITRNGVFMGAGNQATLQYIPLFSGVYEATLVVSDGVGGTTTRSIQFEVQTNVPPMVEQSVQLLQQRVDVQVERQQQRIDFLSERFGENAPPIVQRMINRMVQTQIRMQGLVARRMMVLQRFFSLRGFR